MIQLNIWNFITTKHAIKITTRISWYLETLISLSLSLSLRQQSKVISQQLSSIRAGYVYTFQFYFSLRILPQQRKRKITKQNSHKNRRRRRRINVLNELRYSKNWKMV
ncbi:hypothetical protein CIPAW_11G175400 [Carya illinoinensis]|uniref:Uncharacterized protein n=1 Tax=Carya illinoinensis TaxID=32201 RepID=A0A8T1P428_CARIL|nr:hypothetical protein CIPAW_11G175400 [Carya illinoinensis]